MKWSKINKDDNYWILHLNSFTMKNDLVFTLHNMHILYSIYHNCNIFLWILLFCESYVKHYIIILDYYIIISIVLCAAESYEITSMNNDTSNFVELIFVCLFDTVQFLKRIFRSTTVSVHIASYQEFWRSYESSPTRFDKTTRQLIRPTTGNSLPWWSIGSVWSSSLCSLSWQRLQFFIELRTSSYRERLLFPLPTDISVTPTS